MCVCVCVCARVAIVKRDGPRIKIEGWDRDGMDPLDLEVMKSLLLELNI